MMQYDGELKLPKYYLVPPPSISHTTGEYLAKSGVSTYACSESQKIGHVTFFWNGNRAAPFDKQLETYHEVGALLFSGPCLPTCSVTPRGC
jgi:2,3-bisphosphoglycerate-independent phosphoglycerate mutase